MAANQTREIFSKRFLKVVESELSTFGNNQVKNGVRRFSVFNTDYEGEIKAQGASVVNIPVDTQKGNVRSYVIATGIAPQNISTDSVAITITGDHAINELLDGYELNTIPAKTLKHRMERCARGVAEFIDDDAMAVLEANTNIYKAGATIVAEPYKTWLQAVQKGRKANINFKVALISPEFYTAIKLDNKFITNSDAAQNIKNLGQVGYIDGIPVVVSNRLSAKTQIIFVNPEHATRIMAWKVGLDVVSLSGSSNYIGSSAIKGRLVIKHQITNAKGVLIVTNEK